VEVGWASLHEPLVSEAKPTATVLIEKWWVEPIGYCVAAPLLPTLLFNAIKYRCGRTRRLAPKAHEYVGFCRGKTTTTALLVK